MSIYLGASAWLSTLGFLIGILSLTATTLGVWKAWLEWKKVKAQDSDSYGYKNAMHELYALLSEAQHLLGAKRALLISTENGGNIHNRDGRRYLSVRFESVDFPFQPCRSDFQRYPADEDYHALIDLMLAKKRVLLRPEEMEETSFLRRYYIERGIVASRVQVVHERIDRLCYISFNFIRQDVDLGGPRHLAILDRYAHRIKSVIEKYPEIMDPEKEGKP